VTTWTYSGDPASSSLDEVRFLTGDTLSTASQTNSDEEIAFLLAQQGSVRQAAIAACEALIAKCTALVTQSVGAVSVAYSDRVKQYRELVGTLRRGLTPTPYAGGISVSDKETVESDTDRDAPLFSVGMHDTPGEI
jgi:hypothetical protein